MNLDNTPVQINATAAAPQRISNTGTAPIIYGRDANLSKSHNIGFIMAGASFVTQEPIYIATARDGDTTTYTTTASPNPAGVTLPTYDLLAAMPAWLAAASDKQLFVALDDNGGTLYQNQNGTAVKIAAGVLETGGRELAYAQDIGGTVNITPVNTLVDIPGASITFTVGARPFELKFGAIMNLTNTSAATGSILQANLWVADVTAGNVGIVEANTRVALGAGGTILQQTVEKSFRVSGIAPGTVKTYKLQAIANPMPAGTSVGVLAGAQYPAFIQAVEL